MAESTSEVGVDDLFVLPRVPVSAGALIFDRSGQLLILKPTYKSGWTIPGGVMEADGETPWQACQREVREECGLVVTRARLACVDFRRPRPGRSGGVAISQRRSISSDRVNSDWSPSIASRIRRS